jgi:hypothetical protein
MTSADTMPIASGYNLESAPGQGFPSREAAGRARLLVLDQTVDDRAAAPAPAAGGNHGLERLRIAAPSASFASTTASCFSARLRVSAQRLPSANPNGI